MSNLYVSVIVPSILFHVIQLNEVTLNIIDKQI